MNSTCRLGGLALVVLGLAACEPSRQTGPLATQPTGTAESLLRQQQLQNIQQDRSRAMQNPTVTDVSPGAAGIQRAPTGGTGGTGAGAPVEVSPGVGGITRAPGIGAPTR
ncbi:hypothetical protein [Roseicella aerolata]|uniref:Lipoprotein n=1 Tax=Roseicella aerolata TaxID=2883479 RepID=A0A9X1I8J5_9PROT|nr:hypothetical protein [Roseicella aerolata]MCB4820221.1 hypothetical protein [Roseicella aerolata]